MLRKTILLASLVLPVGALAAPAAKTSTAASSGAVLEPVEDDPFADFAPAPGEAAAPAQAPAPATQAATETTPPPPPVAPGLAKAAPADGTGLYLGPYLRLSGLVVKDGSLGAVAPFGALVRLEGGMEVAPFGAARGLAFELGLGVGVQADSAFDEIEAQLVVTSFQASAIYRQPIFEYLAAYARATGSANVAHLRLATGAFDKEVDQVAADGAIGGTLGLELTIPLGYTPQGSGGRAVSNYLGFFFEAGYELHSSLQFDAARRDVDEDTEPARIPISTEPLGDLNLTGWMWRLGGSFRF